MQSSSTTNPPVRKIAIIILYNDRGEVLLQHRTKDAPVLPDYWAFFGGGIENDETPEEAVRRECFEELSYQLSHPKLIGFDQVVHEGQSFLLHVFIERYDGSRLILGEGQAMGWFAPNVTKDLLMSEHDRAILKTVAAAIETRADER